MMNIDQVLKNLTQIPETEENFDCDKKVFWHGLQLPMGVYLGWTVLWRPLKPKRPFLLVKPYWAIHFGPSLSWPKKTRGGCQVGSILNISNHATPLRGFLGNSEAENRFSLLRTQAEKRHSSIKYMSIMSWITMICFLCCRAGFL